MADEVPVNYLDWHVNLSQPAESALIVGPENNNKAGRQTLVQNDKPLLRVFFWKEDETQTLENVKYPSGSVVGAGGITAKTPVGNSVFSVSGLVEATDGELVWYEKVFSLTGDDVVDALNTSLSVDIKVNIQAADAAGGAANDRGTRAVFDVRLFRDAFDDGAGGDDDGEDDGAEHVARSTVRLYPLAGVLIGDAQDERIFGYFKADQACKISAVIIEAQEAPTGAALTIDLYNLTGPVEMSQLATLADGALYQVTTYTGEGVALTAGQAIRLRIKSIGSTTPGANINVKFICKL